MRGFRVLSAGSRRRGLLRFIDPRRFFWEIVGRKHFHGNLRDTGYSQAGLDERKGVFRCQAEAYFFDTVELFELICLWVDVANIAEVQELFVKQLGFQAREHEALLESRNTDERGHIAGGRRGHLES